MTSQLRGDCEIQNTESAPDWHRVSSCMQHYSLVEHRLSYLSTLMIDLRISYTLNAIALYTNT